MVDLLLGCEPIKAITLWQPWASLMAAGVKRHETRDWDTHHRGYIAIHASQRLDRPGAPECLCQAVFGRDWINQVPLGAIVAIGELRRTTCASTLIPALTEADKASGNFAPGRMAWEIIQVRPLIEPIPCRGRQGLWNWQAPEDIAARLRPPVDHILACHRIGWGLPGKAA